MTVDNHFAGRTAIVTGATRGMGRATAEALVALRTKVVVVARKVEEVDETVRTLGDDHAVGVVANMRDPQSPDRIAEAAMSSFGRIDFIVNNAGTNSAYGPLLEITREALVRNIEINTMAPLALVQSALRAGFGEHPGAAVVNVSTIGARQVQPMVAAYTASKAALDVLSKGLARELGPHGIRVNSVAPGLVETTLSENLWRGERGVEESEILPLKRLGLPDDIAEAVVFLLSDASRWMTGVTLDVDGGRMLIGGEPRDLIGEFDLSRDPMRV